MDLVHSILSTSLAMGIITSILLVRKLRPMKLSNLLEAAQPWEVEEVGRSEVR